MKKTRRPAGETLLELLLYSALLLMMLGGLGMAATLGSRSLQSTGTATEIGREGGVAMAAVVRELQNTRQEVLRVDPTPVGLVLLSPRTSSGPYQHDEAGRLIWQRWVAFYLQQRNGVPLLIRKELPLGAPTSTLPSSIPSVATLQGNSNLRERVVARQVTALEVTPGASTSVRIRAGRGGESVEFLGEAALLP